MNNEHHTNDTEGVDSLGYPRTELETLVSAAAQQYKENVAQHGPGKKLVRTECS